MELHEALSQISEIRRQMARTEVFRGVRALPVACSGCLAILAAGFQALWLGAPLQQIDHYLSLWIGVAIVSFLAQLAEMLIRSRSSSSTYTRDIALLVFEQFFPCLIAGGLLTFVLANFAPETVWMLPGLWQMLFGLGIFATYRLLPKPMFWVAGFYLLSGTICLSLATGDAALSPWAMGVPFGAGQLATAAVLYWTLERNDE